MKSVFMKGRTLSHYKFVILADIMTLKVWTHAAGDLCRIKPG